MAVLCDILNTGTELTLGRTLNRHGAWLGERLFREGVTVRRALTLPDGDIIQEELATSLRRADLVIVTGGLGPTSDDLTREYTAELLATGMTEDVETVERIRRRLEARGRSCGPGQQRQAMVPGGAVVLPNEHGTAPGLAFAGSTALPEYRARLLCLLPGPPAELHPMFDLQVLPLLRQTFAGKVFTQLLKEFHFAGVGEGELAEKMDAKLSHFEGLEIGYCAHSMGTVELRLSGAPDLVQMAEGAIRQAGGADLFSESTPDLERVAIDLLRAAKQSVAVAESCTGGALASRLTDIPGASGVFGFGLVTYANRAKTDLLGVNQSLLEKYGAVSEEVAMAMASGALAVAGAAHAISITGIAGPGGGSEAKPVGTVWIGLASLGAAPIAQRHIFPGGRAMFKNLATTYALDFLRRRLQGWL